MPNEESTQNPSPLRLSYELEKFAEVANGDHVTLGDLVNSLHERGHAILALFLVLPFLQPVPLPGLSTLFGVVIAFLGLLMAMGKPLWLPRSLRNRRLQSGLVHRIIHVGQRILLRFEKVVKPRGKFFHAHPVMQRVVGGLVFVNAALLSLPLPIPLSNFLPAWTIALLALGSIEEDGVVVVMGMTACVVVGAFFMAIGLLPALGVKALAG